MEMITPLLPESVPAIGADLHGKFTEVRGSVRYEACRLITLITKWPFIVLLEFAYILW